MTIRTRVHRTEIPIADETVQTLRGYLRAIAVAPSRRAPTECLEVWYECADIDEDMTVRFHVHGTGHPFTHDRINTPYVGTVFTHDSQLVWHVYAEYPVSEALP